MANLDPRPLLSLAVSLATEAGALIRRGMETERIEVATKSSSTDMVTEIDRASEALIVEGLRRARPGDAVLGEEGATSAGTSGVRWVIDPLDGTTNYLYRLPAFAVSIAAHLDGEPLVGVVHDPTHGDTFSALAGQGSWRNGALLRRAPSPTLDRALIGTGFGYDSARRAAQARLLPAVLPAVRDIRRVGAAALDLCWVADGRLDGFYEAGLKPWDLAAGSLIASEAGAWVGSVPGGRDLPAIVVAAAPGLAGPLQELLARALPSAG